MAYMRRFVLKQGNKWSIVLEEEVDLFYAEEKFCYLRSKRMDQIIEHTLQGLEAKLDPTKFIRVHRKTIVALKQVKSLKSMGSGRYQLIMLDGTVVDTSRSYSQAIKKHFLTPH